MAIVAFAGCIEEESLPSRGILDVLVSDQPNDIGDFRHLNVTITEVEVWRAITSTTTTTETDVDTDSPYGDSETRSRTEIRTETESKVRIDIAPVTVDLVALQGDASASVFREDVTTGTYKRIELEVAQAIGILHDGSVVTVDVPGGRLFLNADFVVEGGRETDFVFDVTVTERGTGDYFLQPNAGESGARA